MIRYIVRRLIMAVFSIWIISMLAFIVIQLPEGDWLDTYIEGVRILRACEMLGTTCL